MLSKRIEIVSKISQSIRARQARAAFDVPLVESETLRWDVNLPTDERQWSIGLIVGPSGSGKSTIVREVFGACDELKWSGASVIDDIEHRFSMAEITDAFSAVGFNTIPAWLRPFRVLSNGEKFRVELARRMLEANKESAVVIDEYSSVVDRHVAQVASHAAQKYIRKEGKKLVAATCHYDVENWLQPDWVYEVPSSSFKWRSLQRRPQVNGTIERVHHSEWERFKRFHYMTSELHKASKCYVAKIDGVSVCFSAVLHFPHPTRKNIKRLHRTVTLPDWQGLGVAHCLQDRLGSALKTLGFELRCYPAHPAFIRSMMRNKNWVQIKEAGVFSPKSGGMSGLGCRPCAVFRFSGAAHPDKDEAIAFLEK